MEVIDGIVEGIFGLQAVQRRLRSDKTGPGDLDDLPLCRYPGDRRLDSGEMQAAEIGGIPFRRRGGAQIVDGVVLARVEPGCREGKMAGWSPIRSPFARPCGLRLQIGIPVRRWVRVIKIRIGRNPESISAARSELQLVGQPETSGQMG